MPIEPVDPLIGAWGDDTQVWQFFDNGTCVLLGPKFNIAGSYKFDSSKLDISGARMQYTASGFINLESSQISLECNLGTHLTVKEMDPEILPRGEHTLRRLSLDESKRLVGAISEKHRNAVRGKKL